MLKNVLILLISLQVLSCLPAKATVLVPEKALCPVGGESIDVYVVMSVYHSGDFDMDFKSYDPGSSLLTTYPECPSNGFVVFKKNFTSAEVDLLTAYVRSKEFLSARNEKTNYRAYLLKRHLGGYSNGELADTLLRATWQAKGFWQYRKYAQEALTYYTKESERLRKQSTDEAFYTMHIRGELSRRLMKYWDAYWVFDFQVIREGAEGNRYQALARHQKWAMLFLWFGKLPATDQGFLRAVYRRFLQDRSYF